MHNATFDSYTRGMIQTNNDLGASASLAVADALNRLEERGSKIEQALYYCITVLENLDTTLKAR